MDHQVLLIEAAAWLVLAVLLLALIGNRFDVRLWPWGGGRQQQQQRQPQQHSYQRLAS